MDIRVPLTLALIVGLAIFWWIDILIDEREMRQWVRPSLFSAIAFVGLMIAGPNETVFSWIAGMIFAALAASVLYLLWIRGSNVRITPPSPRGRE